MSLATFKARRAIEASLLHDSARTEIERRVGRWRRRQARLQFWRRHSASIQAAFLLLYIAGMCWAIDYILRGGR